MPTTVSATAGQYATALGNSRKLFRDSYGKYIAVHKNANVFLDYCNNDPPTSGWSSNDLGSSFAVDAGQAFGVAAAYDSTNDKLMVAFVQSSALKLAQVTFTRDGSHNITGYSAGSILSISPAYSTIHNPALWILHNVEVACVWADEKTGGSKHSVVKFCRVVFGSPPTYKNAAGTASSVDTISSDYTSAFIIRYPTIVERTNAGNGQYDLYAFWNAPNYVPGMYKKAKATWSSPNWSWGAEGDMTAIVCYDQVTCNYDSASGLIVYGGTGGNVDMTVVRVGTIDSSDVDSEISKTGLSSNSRFRANLVISGSDYYIFYVMSAVVYYLKRSGGSWGSETQFTATANENYPSCKVDGAGNRIELIWTHYTGSAYNVYYDSVSLAAPPPGGVLVQIM
jgi:hypothetical protein